MSRQAPEQRFHSILYTRFHDYLQGNDTPFRSVSIEDDVEGRRADIYVESQLTASVVIEVKRDDTYPRDAEHVKQAREYARDDGAAFFATCNSNDFFLFDYQGETNVEDVDFFYVDLRPLNENDPTLDGFVPNVLATIQTLHETGNLPRQSDRERIVGLLKSFHSSVWPSYKTLAENEYESNQQFIDLFDTWVRKNDYGGRTTDEQLEIAAKQFAYQLTNKILFYEVVRDRTPDEIATSDGRPLDSLTGETTVEFLEEHVRRRFDDIVEKIDYEPIFDADTGLFSSFPQNRKTLGTIENLVENVESESITSLDEDLLGGIYEELIPVDEREALGQFYTHPQIARTLCRWSLTQPDTDGIVRVLDPASGSGTFPVEVYQRLHHDHPDATHQALIDRIVAIDINRFPLHLTALNLASQDVSERTDFIHAYNDSFFNIDPETNRIVDTRIDSLSNADSDVVGQFDAVVANPPYVRQENLYPDKEHFRKHLKNFGDANSSPYYDGDKRISKRSDSYVYFVTHSTQFLEEGGRLGFIVPTKWMMTKYGESFQRFVFDHYRIRAVVGFSVRAFEDALVDTNLLLLERSEDETARRNTVTRFVRVKDSVEPDDLVDTVTAEYPIPGDEFMSISTQGSFRTVAVEQSHLMDEGPGKLTPYLKAPRPIIELLSHGMLTPLGQLADVSYGYKTGANRFFYLGEADLETWPIDEQFLEPAIKSFRNVTSPLLERDQTDLYLLDMHDFVETVERQTTDLGATSDVEFRIKTELSAAGHDVVREYIEQGERDGHDETRTCSSRKIWFDLGEMVAPEFLHSKSFNERLFPVWNKGRLVPSDRLYSVNLAPEVDETVLAGILNSSVHKVFLELWGRGEGGGALEVMTYEVNTIPVVDPRELAESAKDPIRNATNDLRNGVDNAQDRLDRAVLDAMNVTSLSVDELQDIQALMAKRRIRSGADVEVLVKRLEAFDELETSVSFTDRGERQDGTSTLDEFSDG